MDTKAIRLLQKLSLKRRKKKKVQDGPAVLPHRLVIVATLTPSSLTTPDPGSTHFPSPRWLTLSSRGPRTCPRAKSGNDSYWLMSDSTVKFIYITHPKRGFPGGASVERTCQCTRHETQVRSLSWENPLEKGMATHSSILAWRIPWTEEPGGLSSMGLHRVRHDWSDLAAAG